MDLGPEQIRWIIQALVILVLSICVHEYGHAIVADKLGDPLPRSQGRTTLNPLSHADPIGTLVFPLMALIAMGAPGFGWGRPVMVSPHNFTRKMPMRKAHLLVALAGPGMNLLFALVIALTHFILLTSGTIAIESGGRGFDTVHELLSYAVLLNAILAVFNLIPAKPLDGGTVLEGLLPSRWVPSFERFSVYGPFVIMGLILIPGAYQIIGVPAMLVTRGIHSLFGIVAF